LARQTQERADSTKPARLAIVASDATDLVRKIEQAEKTISSRHDADFSTPTGVDYTYSAEPGEVAFLFPGQGSQYVHMGADTAMTFDVVREVFDRAAAMKSAEHEGLHEVVWPHSAYDEDTKTAQHEALTRTDRAQPAIGALSLGMLSLLERLGVTPDVVGGHSFGEVTAMVAAGALDEETFLRVARKRGELMAEAASIPGSMTAVVTDIDKLHELLDAWDLDVVVANHNSPTQVVLSGPTSAVENVEYKLRDECIKFRRLHVGTAFHSPVVSPSSEPFLEFLSACEVRAPKIPVYANTQAAPYTADADAVREGLADQIRSSVRFVEQIEAMHEAGVRTFVEVGPRAVLTNLVERILGDREYTAIHTDRRGKHGVSTLFRALGQLFTRGVALDFAPLWESTRPVVDPRTVKKSPFTLKLNGANYDKPAPISPIPTKPRPEPRAIAAAAPKATTPSAPAAPSKVAPVPASPTRVPQTQPARREVHMSQESKKQPAAQPPHVSSADQRAWLDAFERLQDRTAQAHDAYQSTMADSHRAFLAMAQSSFEGLSNMLHAEPVTLDAQPAPTAQLPAPRPVAQAPVPLRPATLAPTPAPTSKPAPISKPTPAASAAPAAPAAPVAPSVNLTGLMLDVVAEKTGYPAEMLNLSMELESDLGIDSIKRVEILSVMQERVPSMPEVETSRMAQL
ncbi:MAG: acyltransferase domain-containing protein, partial [Myxococcota bacterium]